MSDLIFQLIAGKLLPWLQLWFFTTQPYANSALNSAEVLALITCFIILATGMFFFFAGAIHFKF